MFKIGNEVHLLLDNTNGKRKLASGKVVGLEGSKLTAEFSAFAAPGIEQDVLVFAEWNSKFHQQGARITEIVTTETGSLKILFETIGRPVSAETRGSYRVSVLTAEIAVRIGSESQCTLADVSPEGWSVIVKRAPKMGALVDASIQIEQQSLEGPARVQSIKELGGNRFRVGFFAPETDQRMRGSLGRLSASAQRMQLRRMSRSA